MKQAENGHEKNESTPGAEVAKDLNGSKLLKREDNERFLFLDERLIGYVT